MPSIDPFLLYQISDCAKAIRFLREEWDWEFVAVTARWGAIERCRTNTERWLEAHGLAMPVYYASYPYPTDSPRVAFKAGVIQKLKESRTHGEVLVGIGDRPSDMKAYVKNNLLALIVMDALGECASSPQAHKEMLLTAEKETRKAGAKIESNQTIEYVKSDSKSVAWEQIQNRLGAIAEQRAIKRRER